MNKSDLYVRKALAVALPIIPFLGWYFLNEEMYNNFLMGRILTFMYGVALAAAISLARLSTVRSTILCVLMGVISSILYPIFEVMYFMMIFALLGFLFSGLSGKWKWSLLYLFTGALLPIVADSLICLAGFLREGCPASAGYLTGNLLTFCWITYVPLCGLIGLDYVLNQTCPK